MTSTPEDIELPEAAQTTAGPSVASLKVTAGQVVVDENHPFDLDAYLSSYTGMPGQVDLKPYFLI